MANSEYNNIMSYRVVCFRCSEKILLENLNIVIASRVYIFVYVFIGNASRLLLLLLFICPVNKYYIRYLPENLYLKCLGEATKTKTK